MGAPKKYSATTKNIVHCIRASGWSSGFRPPELKVARDCDAARDLVLQGEQIARVAVEAVGPQMRVPLGIN